MYLQSPHVKTLSFTYGGDYNVNNQTAIKFSDNVATKKKENRKQAWLCNVHLT